MRVVLLRHGRTTGNTEKRYQGCRSDVPLDPEAVKEIPRCAQSLEALLGKDACVCAGSLMRTVQTAEAIVRAWGREDSHDVIRIIDGLTEIDFGVFEGKTYEELKSEPAYVQWLDDRGFTPPPGGEGRGRFVLRSMEGFQQALALAGERNNLLIVCHGGNVMAVMSSLFDGDYYDYAVNCLDGYILELDRDDDRVSALTYSRLSDRAFA